MPRPVRVLFLSIVPSPYQRDLFARLAGRDDVDVRVVYCEAGSPDSPWPEKELAPFESVMPGFHLSWGGSRFLVNLRVPSVQDADVVVCNGYMTLAAQRLMRRCRGRVPVLFWGEKMVAASPGLKGAVQRWIARPLRRVDGFVAIGRGAKEDYERRYPRKPVCSIPYFCEMEVFRVNRPRRPRFPPVILFCGQMIGRKGLDLLLKAFARVRETGLEAKLLLVGREEALPAMLREIPERFHADIENAGFQAPEALPGFFRRADLFVLPSRYDGWGVVVNQAVGAGLPVVVSDAVGAGPDLVLEGRNGYVFPAGDADSLAERMTRLLRDPSCLAEASDASWNLAPSFFPERGAELWARALRRIHEGTD